MSRGHGALQRSLLTILPRHDRYAKPQACAEGLDTLELTHKAYGITDPKLFKLVTGSQETSVRRALASLAREGAVIKLGALRGPWCHWRVVPRKAV